MPTYPRPETPDEYERKIAEGRGSGEGPNYKPWIYTHEISSLGNSSNIYSFKQNREIHLLSDLEKKAATILEFSLKVDAYYEQYPLLPLDRTIAIAEKHGIEHPKDPKSGYPKVITTDILAAIKTNEEIVHAPISIKYSNVFQPDRSATSSNTLEDLRTLAKLEIERLAWLELGHQLKIFTELDIPDSFFRNIDQALYHYQPSNNLAQEEIKEISAYLTRRVSAENLPLRQITSECDRELGYSKGSGVALSIFWYLIAHHKWVIDLSILVDPNKPVKLLSASI